MKLIRWIKNCLPHMCENQNSQNKHCKRNITFGNLSFYYNHNKHTKRKRQKRCKIFIFFTCWTLWKAFYIPLSRIKPNVFQCTKSYILLIRSVMLPILCRFIFMIFQCFRSFLSQKFKLILFENFIFLILFLMHLLVCNLHRFGISYGLNRLRSFGIDSFWICWTTILHFLQSFSLIDHSCVRKKVKTQEMFTWCLPHSSKVVKLLYSPGPTAAAIH